METPQICIIKLPPIERPHGENQSHRCRHEVGDYPVPVGQTCELRLALGRLDPPDRPTIVFAPILSQFSQVETVPHQECSVEAMEVRTEGARLCGLDRELNSPAAVSAFQYNRLSRIRHFAEIEPIFAIGVDHPFAA